jgi:3-isopropylmalate dehydrogenase
MAQTKRIAVLPGDGIGPDVTAEGVRILRAVEPSLDIRFDLEEYSVGAGEYLRSGHDLPPATMDRVKECDAILLGAMGLPDVRRPNGTEIAPQIDLREEMELYCGLRPVRLHHPNDTPLKGYQAGEIDFAIVRESTEGLFFSRKGTYSPDAAEVRDTMRISRLGAERVARSAFRVARTRRKRCTLIDKANVLPSMAFFRQIFYEVAREFPDVRADHVYVDAAALFLVRQPREYDVMVTENMFGDILSDLAAALVGGMGMAPSADIGDRHAVFQPAHGSAPDIAGKGIANPVATILSVALMLDWLGQPDGARRIERAVDRVFADPSNRTRDMGGTLTTTEMGALVAGAL